MDHSKTPLWTIPNFNLEELLPFRCEIPNILFTFANSTDPAHRASVGYEPI